MLALERSARNSWSARFCFDDILGHCEPIRQSVQLARRASQTEFPILLIGESGTGKELFAQAIHRESAERVGPFVPLNCGELGGELAVTELCGHEPGSFTGADRQTRAGFFDIANGGTLFLDELQDMPPSAQSVFLRFLETGSFVRVGGRQPVRATVRVVAASNFPIGILESGTRIRSDLLYRLNCVIVEIPPLRERRTDIRLIADKCLRHELHFLGEVDEGFWNKLVQCPYPWPGNVRELRNILIRAILTSTQDRLRAEDIPVHLMGGEANSSSGNVENTGSRAPADRDQSTLESTLEASHYNVSETARRLGIHRSTFYRRMGRIPR
jgi:sigma-54 dependent transcriptional regulator, acetoin dehydrogenase operon transcriptional activator AcoR